MTATAELRYNEEELHGLLNERPQIIASQSIIYFGYTYFPHLCNLAPSQFHDEITDDMDELILVESEEGKYVALAAPRGFAKTTWVSVILPLWCIVHNYKYYIIQIQAAAKNAEDQLENVKYELTENKALMNDYPNACGEGPVWRANSIVTRNGVKVDAVGSGQKVRGRLHHGKRPDLIILDDVETDENVQTPAQREKLLRWFNRAVLKAGHRLTDYFLIGTVLHTESLLNTRLSQPGYITRKYKAIIQWADRRDLWDQWTALFTDLYDEDREETAKQFFLARKKEMLAGTKVLWEERWSYYDLMIEYVRDGPYAFSSERQNDPTEADSLVTREEMQFYEAKELNIISCEYIVGGVDPSLGKTIHSDMSAIIHVGLDSLGQMYVLNASIARRKPDDIIKDTLDISMHRVDPWPFPMRQDAFLVEAIQFQEYFKTNMDKASEEMRAYLPTIPVHPRANKLLRIMSIQPLIKNGYLKFRNDGTQETLINQITSFPHGKMDGPDCLAMICAYIAEHRVIGSAITVPANFGYAYGQF